MNGLNPDSSEEEFKEYFVAFGEIGNNEFSIYINT